MLKCDGERLDVMVESVRPNSMREGGGSSGGGVDGRVGNCDDDDETRAGLG